MARVLVVLASLAATSHVESAATTHAQCAAMVPDADVSRGKSAFFSSCYPSTGGMVPSGCWSPGQYTVGQGALPVETASEGYGCQTCVMTNSKFAAAVFPVFWAAGKRDQLAPCPEDEFNYAAFHATSPVVTAASIIDTDECEAGWFYSANSGRCYFKSDRFTVAENWDEANNLCRAKDAALVDLEDAVENDWFIYNLLWPGVMGETFTSLLRADPGETGTWDWVRSGYLNLAHFGPKSFTDWYPGMTSANYYPTPSNAPDRRSCMEIYPQLPKGWNPFSCAVNKQYACVKNGKSSRGSPTPVPPQATSQPNSSGSPTATKAPTKAPSAAAGGGNGDDDETTKGSGSSNGGSSDGGISGGAAAGIAVGCIAGAAVLAAGTVFMVRRRRMTTAGPAKAAAASVEEGSPAA